MAQTVLGPVDAADPGVTIMHEHLLAYAPHVVKMEPAEASKRATFNARLGIDILGRLRYGGEANRDSCSLQDAETAMEEVSLYRQAGGRTVVDATSIGIGRDPVGLARIARATGPSVVMVSSYYVEESYPPGCWIEDRGEEDIAAEIVRDIFEGAQGIRRILVDNPARLLAFA
jgi:phosphotriesterase-related protein